MGKASHRYWGVERPITFTHTYEGAEGNEIERQVTHTALVVFSEATYRNWRSKYIEQLRDLVAPAALSQVLQEEVKDRQRIAHHGAANAVRIWVAARDREPLRR